MYPSVTPSLQPGLPMKKGRAATMTHDYKRNGTTTLFAALNVLDGHVIGQCQQKHTHVEWLKFLRQIDRETPKGKTLLRPTLFRVDGAPDVPGSFRAVPGMLPSVGWDEVQTR